FAGPWGRPFAADEPADEGHDLASARSRDLLELEVRPLLDQDVAAANRLVGMGRERTCVDRADRRSAKDVDGNRPPDVLGDLGENVQDDAYFVGSTRRTPRQNEPDKTAGHAFKLSPSAPTGPVLM